MFRRITHYCFLALLVGGSTAGSFSLGAVIVDRSPPVESAEVRIKASDALAIVPGGRIDIDVEVHYLRSCRTDIHRALYDSSGTRYALPELMLPAPPPGIQHSSTTMSVPMGFAPGDAQYISHVSYACNWFQRLFWPISVPERLVHFYVTRIGEAP